MDVRRVCVSMSLARATFANSCTSLRAMLAPCGEGRLGRYSGARHVGRKKQTRHSVVNGLRMTYIGSLGVRVLRLYVDDVTRPHLGCNPIISDSSPHTHNHKRA